MVHYFCHPRKIFFFFLNENNLEDVAYFDLCHCQPCSQQSNKKFSKFFSNQNLITINDKNKCKSGLTNSDNRFNNILFFIGNKI